MNRSWDTTERDEDSVEAAARPKMWLKWVFPADTCLELEHGLVLGRDAACRARLDGGRVSRRHAELHRQGPIFAIKDLGSTNGTYLNGKRVEHAPVAPGGVLRVGDHLGVFVECVDAPRAFESIAPGLFGGHAVEVAFAPVRRAACTDIPIVILGATGTGKERVARAIHELSGRKGSFQALHCAAIPKDLAEAELFGYRKGAFTGAERASLGRFRAADRGTLFLDEVAELPLELQAKLLRVVEERAVTPLGETEGVPIDVRIVVAAQWSLSELVAAKRFREDLFARFAGLTVCLPALRERVSDIAPLFEHFVREYSGGRPPKIETKLIEYLCLHSWPGNVRELEQLARRLRALHGHEPALRRSFLPPELRSLVTVEGDSLAPPSGDYNGRRDHDRYRLAVALKQASGNVTAAAAQAGFSRQRAYRLLDGLAVSAFVVQELTRFGEKTNGAEGASGGDS